MATSLQSIQQLLKSPDPIRWVFAGDSITHGALHTMGWRDYVELFGERVRWEMGRMRDCVIKTACSGWRITNLRDDFEWSIAQHRPHVVSINVGMNDCVAGTAGRMDFEKTYLEVVNRIREKTSTLVLLHTPTRILPLDASRAPYLADYACAVREVAAKTDSPLVDNYADWEAFEANNWMAYLLSDAIHPNECGHRLMNRSLLQILGIWDEKTITGRLLIPSPAA